MGLFSFFSGKAGGSRISRQSLHLDGVRQALGIDAAVIAISRNDRLIYSNDYEPELFFTDSGGDSKFRGPVFKIILTMTTGDRFFIIYGIVSDDRERVMSFINNSLLDNLTLIILNELYQKCPGIYDPRQFDSAPCQFTYHLYKTGRGFYMTDNRGRSAHYIDFASGQVHSGTRGEITDLMTREFHA